MADKDFDIKRAYEKWVEQGQPVYSDSKKDGRKSAGKSSDHRTKGHEEKSSDRIASRGRDADEEKQYRPKFVADPDAPQCPYRRRCGGCEYIGRNYKWTLAQKEKKTFTPFTEIQI